MTMSRRSLLALAATSPAAAALLGTTPAWAGSAEPMGAGKAVKVVPPLALNISVAHIDGEPVVSRKWLTEQVTEAQRLMSPHGVSVGVVTHGKLSSSYALLENANERDAVSKELEPDVINAFFVKSLRDVDKPKRFIRGVRWRNRKDLSKDYVIVSSIAGPLTLCHELGHFLGNGHSYVVNNVMSYKHEDHDKIAFNKRQGAKMRQVATRLLRTSKVLSVHKWSAKYGPE